MPLPLVASGIALADALVRMFAPVNRLIDEFQISDEGRARAKAEMTAFQNDALALALAVEKDRLAAQASMLVAEAGGQSWLQRNWRPITMLSFLGLVVADSFGLLAFRLADQAWLLLQIGLGGYVVGRSFEKFRRRPMVPSINPCIISPLLPLKRRAVILLKIPVRGNW
jgi:hypothetical protein